MANIVLFHHALGLTPGCHSLADRLRADGHTVHLPDLYGGAVFDTLDDGMAHLEALDFDAVVERGCRAAGDHRGPLVVAGISLGVMPAQRLAQTRPEIVAGVFIEACAPVDAFADRWPDAVAVQVHGMDGDEFFAGEGDLDNARDLIAHAAATADAELFTYPGAAHLFVDDSTDGHDRAATDLVVERMLALLGRVDDASMATHSGSQDFEGAT